LKNDGEKMSEYSIATFLERMSDDELEREIIRLLFKDLTNEELLDNILKLVRGKKKF